VRHGADRAGDTNDEQRRRDRLLGIQAGQEHQDRHGQDRTAATEHAQGQPDQHRRGHGDDDHAAHRSSLNAATTAS
jgi:hypothetical protein